MLTEKIPFEPDPDYTGEGKTDIENNGNHWHSLLYIFKKNDMREKLFLFIILSISQYSIAQYYYQGEVMVEDSPVVGATIHILESDQVVVTDQLGKFIFEYKSNEVEVEVNFVGLSPQRQIIFSNYTNILQLSPSDFNQTLEPVFISEQYPVTQTTISKQSIESSNLGQDIPILLDQLPSVVSTSDAGTGIGYTSIRVRGSDASRVNVTINNIPLNDSESQGVFWVNMPDFLSSTDRITLLRGVGTSTNGAGAFGASLHVKTEDGEKSAYANYTGSFGSFNTMKHTIKVGTGDRNGWNTSARFSKIKSDGYIDRANSDLQSYFFQSSKKIKPKTVQSGELKFITFSGHENTYQAWYGVAENMLETNRTFNPYTYENQVDNYKQSHYQLHWNQNYTESIGSSIALHYTKGKGYYEEYKEQDALVDYGINNVFIGDSLIQHSDIVRRRWLDNDFYGIVGSVDWEKNKHSAVLGGGWNKYMGNHFGEIIQGEFVPQEFINEKYYSNNANKTDLNIYAKYIYDWHLKNLNSIIPFVDLQYRIVQYDFVGLALDGSGAVQELPQQVIHHFFNPKFGVTYQFDDGELYSSYARAQKEPNRSDYTDSNSASLPKAEQLDDFELGLRLQKGQLQASINGYYMNYKNQLALTGGINDVGAYTRVNVDKSYRAGIEFSAGYQFDAIPLSIAGNATFSKNKIKSFVEYIDDYDFGGQQEVVHRNTDLALSPNEIASGNIKYEPKDWLTIQTISKFVGRQYLDNTSTKSRSLDSYFTQNVTLGADLSTRQNLVKELKINVLVNNLFNSLYENNGYSYGYFYGGDTIYENYYYPQAGINFLAGIQIGL